ncbi:MAG: type II toxin-antitoxin system VapB family antitoxin [Bryobacteraceae bacterium]|nr:type II toxin-antitoxin system VapB family antitoxin [Bryobacteraceae bacterium]
MTPLNIKDAEAYQLATAIANHTGKSLTRVVVAALRAEAARLRLAGGVDARQARATLDSLHSFP